MNDFVTMTSGICHDMQKDNEIERLLNAACCTDGAHIRHNVAPCALIMADGVTEGSVAIPATKRVRVRALTARGGLTCLSPRCLPRCRRGNEQRQRVLCNKSSGEESSH